MSNRIVQKVLPSINAGGGGRVFIKQPLPHQLQDQVSPFILLHHAGPVNLAPFEESISFGAHPHRGFMPVTFLFSGEGHHKDSMGNDATISSGGVQWLNAASGMIHDESQPESFHRSGGMLDLIQLWINLPQSLKSAKPSYVNAPSEEIPLIERDGYTVKVVSGEFAGEQGAIEPPIPIDSFMIEMQAGATLEIPTRKNWNALVFNLGGSITIEGKQIQDDELAVLTLEGEQVEIKASAQSRLLFLAGEPINEPMVSYGPFVMNTMDEIRESYENYKAGKMGVVA